MNTRLIVALDLESRDAAEAMIDRLGDTVSWYKIGKQMFTRYGPDLVAAVRKRGKQVFLDLKYHDIPNTVGRAIDSALELGVAMLNVHASGGPAMLEAAAEAKASTNPDAILIAVTVLTSMDAGQLDAVGVTTPVADQVVRLARLAENAGLDGVVASALEIGPLRQACSRRFQLVVPGVRPAGADRGDQRRVMTPGKAASAGADYIVVGRPILRAEDPAAAAAAIRAELAAATDTPANPAA